MLNCPPLPGLAPLCVLRKQTGQYVLKEIKLSNGGVTASFLSTAAVQIASYLRPGYEATVQKLSGTACSQSTQALSKCPSSYTNKMYKAQLLSLAPVRLSTRGEVQGNHKVWIAQRTT